MVEPFCLRSSSKRQLHIYVSLCFSTVNIIIQSEIFVLTGRELHVETSSETL